MAEGTGAAPAGGAAGGAGAVAPASPVAAGPSGAPGVEGQEPQSQSKVKPIPPGATPGAGKKADEAAGEKDAPAKKEKPSKPRLPGVHGHDDFDSEGLELPRRDPKTGQFLTKEERRASWEKEAFERGDIDKSETISEPGEMPTDGKPPRPPGAPEPAPKLKVAGKEYGSLADVEHEVKSLQGQFKNLNDTIKLRTEERDYGYQTANEWINVVKEREARIAELEHQLSGGNGKAGGSAPGRTAPASTSARGNGAVGVPSVEDILAEVDTDGFETLAYQPGGLRQASKYLAAEILNAVNEKIVPVLQGRIDQETAGFKSEQQERAAYAAAEQAFEQVAALQDPRTGQPAFPELIGDDATVGLFQQKLGMLAVELGLPDEVAMTPRGIMQLIASYRMFNGYIQPETPVTAGPPNPTVVPAGVPLGAPGAAALVDADAGRTLPAHDGRTSGQSPATRRFTRELENFQMRDPVLGFTRNPPAR